MPRNGENIRDIERAYERERRAKEREKAIGRRALGGAAGTDSATSRTSESRAASERPGATRNPERTKSKESKINLKGVLTGALIGALATATIFGVSKGWFKGEDRSQATEGPKTEDATEATGAEDDAITYGEEANLGEVEKTIEDLYDLISDPYNSEDAIGAVNSAGKVTESSIGNPAAAAEYLGKDFDSLSAKERGAIHDYLATAQKFGAAAEARKYAETGFVGWEAFKGLSQAEAENLIASFKGEDEANFTALRNELNKNAEYDFTTLGELKAQYGVDIAKIFAQRIVNGKDGVHSDYGERTNLKDDTKLLVKTVRGRNANGDFVMKVTYIKNDCENEITVSITIEPDGTPVITIDEGGGDEDHGDDGGGDHDGGGGETHTGGGEPSGGHTTDTGGGEPSGGHTTDTGGGEPVTPSTPHTPSTPTTPAKNTAAEKENAGEYVTPLSIDNKVTPPTTLEQDQKNFEAIRKQQEEDQRRAEEAARRQAEQQEAERRAAAEAEARRKADEEAAAKRQAEREAAIRAEQDAAARLEAEQAERDRQAREAEQRREADEAARKAEDEARARQEASAAAERQAAAERESRERAQAEANAAAERVRAERAAAEQSAAAEQRTEQSFEQSAAGNSTTEQSTESANPASATDTQRADMFSSNDF